MMLFVVVLALRFLIKLRFPNDVEQYMSLNNINPSIVGEFHETKYVACDLRKNFFADFQRQRQHLME